MRRSSVRVFNSGYSEIISNGCAILGQSPASHARHGKGTLVSPMGSEFLLRYSSIDIMPSPAWVSKFFPAGNGCFEFIGEVSQGNEGVEIPDGREYPFCEDTIIPPYYRSVADTVQKLRGGDTPLYVPLLILASKEH